MPMDKEYASILLERVFNAQLPSDQITLISGKDNRSFLIHRNILTAASEYFAASLGPNFEEGKHDDFTFKGMDGETLKAIVDYCYTGCIDLTEENVKTFMIVASSVALDLLEAKCRKFYYRTLNISNAVEMFMIADTYSYVDMRQQVLDFICKKFEEIPIAQSQKLNHQLFREVLECEKMNASEKLIFDHLLEWSRVEMDKRAKYMPDLLKLIRLEYIDSETLSNVMEPTYEKFNCLKHLMSEFKRRALSHRLQKQGRWYINFFFVCTQQDSDGITAIKIGDYSDSSQRYKDILEIPMRDRKWFNTLIHGKKIYVMGGVLNGIALNYVSAFDLSTGQEEVLPPMKHARSLFTSIMYQKCIYVFGGWTTKCYTSSCERYDTETKTWSAIKSMQMGRGTASATVLNGRIYVAGGFNGSTNMTDVESYGPASDSWTRLASMNKSRVIFALVESNDFLHAFGDSKIAEKYDLSTNDWTEVGSFNGCDTITSGANIKGQIIATKKNGGLGRIEIDADDKCSFFPLGDTKHESGNHLCHFIFPN